MYVVWGCVCVYFIIRYTDIDRLAPIFCILCMIFTIFSFRLFAVANISWQLIRKHFSLHDYRATMSAYALAHFTYRNSKPPFSNDRWPSRRILFQGNKDTVTFFFSFNRLARKRDRSIDFFHRSKIWISTIAIRILQRFILALSSSFVPFLKLSDWL